MLDEDFYLFGIKRLNKIGHVQTPELGKSIAFFHFEMRTISSWERRSLQAAALLRELTGKHLLTLSF